MKKFATTIVLGTLSVVLMAGCAASPAAGEARTAVEGQTPSTVAATTAAAVEVPKPTAAQESRLKTEFAKINPAFNAQMAVSAAQRQCAGILEGWPEAKQLATTKMAFPTKGSKPVTEAEAKRIIKVIKANGFCKA